MRSALLSAGLAAMLVASLAGKAGNLAQSAPAQTVSDEGVSAFLEARGFAVEIMADEAVSAWIVAIRGKCEVRVADVSPQGWSRDVIAAQAQGGKLLYAFDGVFYADQPVLRTVLGEYRRRLRHYLRLPAKPFVVRAVMLSPGCKDMAIRAEDAPALSR
jgi:hypothetical protein